jgi:hypothetical protein
MKKSVVTIAMALLLVLPGADVDDVAVDPKLVIAMAREPLRSVQNAARPSVCRLSIDQCELDDS